MEGHIYIYGEITSNQGEDAKVYGYVNPRDVLSQIKAGQTVSLHVAAYPKTAFSGEIYAISPNIDPRSHSIKVKARIDNETGQLRRVQRFLEHQQSDHKDDGR